MKQKIKMIAKDVDRTVVAFEVSIDCRPYVLTRDEQVAFKADLLDKTFELLRSVGFLITEIKFK